MKNLEKTNIPKQNKTNINNVIEKTESELKWTFEVSNKDKKDFKKLWEIYFSLFNIKKKDSLKRTQELIVEYIQTYINSNENVQGIFEWRLEKLLNKKAHLRVFADQIKREWWLLQYGERRLGIK